MWNAGNSKTNQEARKAGRKNQRPQTRRCLMLEVSALYHGSLPLRSTATRAVRPCRSPRSLH